MLSRRLKKYKRNRSFKEFYEESMFHDAVIREIEIMGEAVKHITLITKERYPNIPWKDIVGM